MGKLVKRRMGKHLILLLKCLLPLKLSNLVWAHKSVIGSYQRSETSCRRINLPVWGSRDPSSRTQNEGGRGGAGRGFRRRGKKNNGICCSERSGRGRRNWTVDLGNAMRSERGGVYIITGEIRLSLREESAHDGAAKQKVTCLLVGKINRWEKGCCGCNWCSFMKVSACLSLLLNSIIPTSSFILFYLAPDSSAQH